MAMITKTEAQTFKDTFHAGLPDRVAVYLRNLAQSGILGGVITYDAATPTREVNATLTALTNAGWAVVNDSNAKTLTIT